MEADAPCELVTKAKPEAGTRVEASKPVVAEPRTSLRLNRLFIFLSFVLKYFRIPRYSTFIRAGWLEQEADAVLPFHGSDWALFQAAVVAVEIDDASQPRG